MDRGMGKEDNRGNDVRQKIRGSRGRGEIHELRGKSRMKLGRRRKGDGGVWEGNVNGGGGRGGGGGGGGAEGNRWWGG